MDGKRKGMGRLGELGPPAAILADGAVSEATCHDGGGGSGQASHKADKEQ